METDDDVPEEWLEAFNARMSKEGVPHMRRPFLALMEWTGTRSCAILGGSRTEDKLFQWFYDRSPAGAHLVPDMYEGPFYFDSGFWPMRVPQIYGQNLSINITEFLDMPGAVKKILLQDAEASAQYKGTWADCFDYSYGFDDVAKAQSQAQTPFFASAGQQLLAAAKLLMQRPPEPRAMEASRMAVEMFLKAYLCVHHGFTEAKAAAHKHRLGDLLKTLLSLKPDPELAALATHLSIFPEIGERYEGKEYSGKDLWHAYRIALYVGASLIRSISDRDMRPQLGVVFQ